MDGEAKFQRLCWRAQQKLHCASYSGSLKNASPSLSPLDVCNIEVKSHVVCIFCFTEGNETLITYVSSCTKYKMHRNYFAVTCRRSLHLESTLQKNSTVFDLLSTDCKAKISNYWTANPTKRYLWNTRHILAGCCITPVSLPTCEWSLTNWFFTLTEHFTPAPSLQREALARMGLFRRFSSRLTFNMAFSYLTPRSLIRF